MTGPPEHAASPGDRAGPAWLRAIEGPTPLVAWAAAAWLGALVGWAAAPPMAVRSVVAGLAALATGTVAVLAVGRTRRRNPIAGPRRAVAGSAGTDRHLARTVVGVVVVAAVAAGGALARAASLDRGPLARLAEQGGAAPVEATVASEPVVRDDGTAWVLATVTRVGVARGRWRALVSGLRDPPVVGARLGAVATARPLDHGGFEDSLRRRHVGVELDGAWSRLEPAGGVMGRIDDLRTRIRTAARRGLHGDAAALAVGLVTGDTRGLSRAAEDGMRATGLTHLVAVSGSNVALVLGVVAVACRRWPRWSRRVLLVAALVGFTVTTRVEPSVLRAAAMAGLVLACDLRGVPAGAVHALAGTVLVLVLVDPAAAGSLGLVLSALATGGVLVVAPAVAGRLPDRLPRPLRLLLAATLGAQVAVAPVLLATVGELPLVSVPANLVAVPAAAVASVLATIGAALAPILPGVSGLAFALAGPPLGVVLAVAERMRGPVLSSAEPGVALALLVLVVVAATRGRRLRRVGVVLAVLAALAWGPPGAWMRGRIALPAGVLSVTAVDVGQGDAVLVTTASGHRMLVDVGGDEAAATWLRRHGIRRLDLLVLTHPHADHVGGLPEVLAEVDVAATWVGVAADGRPPDLAVVPTSRGPRPTGVDPTTEVVAVRAGQRARLGSATVEVLGPPPAPDLVATEGADNDRSVVLRVVEGDRVALLTGDAEVAAQRWLLAQGGGTLAAGLLKVPHHGGATTEPEFLAAVAPRVAVVSVGRDNDYGHPDPRLLARLVDLGAAVHRTDLVGTVTVVVPPPGGQERPVSTPSDEGTAGAASTRARPPAARPAAPARGPPRPRHGRAPDVGRRPGRARAGRPGRRRQPPGPPAPGSCPCGGQDRAGGRRAGRRGVRGRL